MVADTGVIVTTGVPPGEETTVTSVRGLSNPVTGWAKTTWNCTGPLGTGSVWPGNGLTATPTVLIAAMYAAGVAAATTGVGPVR